MAKKGSEATAGRSSAVVEVDRTASDAVMSDGEGGSVVVEEEEAEEEIEEDGSRESTPANNGSTSGGGGGGAADEDGSHAAQASTKKASAPPKKKKGAKSRHNEQMLFVFKKVPVFERITTEEDQVSDARLRKVAEEVRNAREKGERLHAQRAFIAAWSVPSNHLSFQSH